jgi:hypothetical protein
MYLSNLTLIKNHKSTILQCSVRSSTENKERLCYIEFFSCEPVNILERYDPFIIGLLPAAMARGENLEVDGSIDIQLHNNLNDAIALFETWFPKEVKKNKITCNGYTHDSKIGSRIMSFFSGGVDAVFNCVYFDSVYTNYPVTDLVLVQGMDIGLGETPLWNETCARLGDTASKLGKNLITVKTNLRDFQHDYVNYTHTGFGPILGSVSNLFSPDVRLSLIGSYGLFSELAPHASGPLIDRLWSSSNQSVTHFTPRFSRLDKIRWIAKLNQDCLKNLRVCWKNPAGSYNCGICEKCLRTRMELKIIDALDIVDTFPRSDIKDDIKLLGDGIPEDDIYTYYFWKEIASLEKNASIVKSIHKSLRSYRYRRNIYTTKIKFKQLKKLTKSLLHKL